jgi:hypothetical protein
VLKSSLLELSQKELSSQADDFHARFFIQATDLTKLSLATAESFFDSGFTFDIGPTLFAVEVNGSLHVVNPITQHSVYVHT